MDTIFRKSRTRTSVPVADLQTSVPYSQLPSSRPPTAGPSSYNVGRNISSPNTNPGLAGDEGTPLNVANRDYRKRDSDRSEMPPPRRTTSRTSTTEPDSRGFEFGRRTSDAMSIASITSHEFSRYPTMPKNTYAPSVQSVASISEEFNHPRPPDEEVERLFQRLLQTRDFDGSLTPSSSIAETTSSLSVDTKWQMVESDLRGRWEAARHQTKEMRHGKNAPEWFLKKMLNGNLTKEHLASLYVSLRTMPMDWMRNFMACKGQVVMANYLANLSTKRGRSGYDVEIELELLKCFKKSIGNKLGTDDALANPSVIFGIAQSLVSPSMPCRKLSAEILTYFCHWDELGTERVGLKIVLRGLDVLEASSSEGRFGLWLHQFEMVSDGRGRMGSAVGRELKGVDDSSITDYCAIMLCLALGLASHSDLRARCSIRAQMESAGLLRIFEKIKVWNEENTYKHILSYEKEAEADRADLKAEQGLVMVSSLRNPEEVFRALLQATKGSKSSSYLLNSLRHLLLIKGSESDRYYQLIDQLITSIVMNDTPELSDFSRAFGISVSHLMGKFVEQDKLDASAGEIKSLKAALAQAARDKAELSDEISKGDEGMVGELKAHVADLEERLRKSRAATETLADQMEGMKRDYEQRIADLELYILELYNMLKETNHLDEIAEMSEGPIDRKQLIHNLREQWERKKTIKKLEGSRKSKLAEVNGDDDAEEVIEAGPSRRTSQFADAEDERVRSHIEATLAKVDGVSPMRLLGSSSRSARNESPRSASGSPHIGEKSLNRLSKKPGLPPRFLEELRYRNFPRSSSAPEVSDYDSDFSDFRESGFTQNTSDTGYTSISDHRKSNGSRKRDSFSNQILNRARTVRGSSVEAEDDIYPQTSPSLPTLEEEHATENEVSPSDYPSAPPPPPPPPPPPLPPPPPPPPGGGGLPPPGPPGRSMPPGMGGMNGLLAGIAGGVKLKSAGFRPETKPTTKSNSNTPDSNTVSRAPLAPISSLFHGANDSRKDVALIASKKMKQLQWEKVGKNQLSKTVWNRPEIQEDDLIDKMKSVDVWSEMENEFKAREIIHDAFKKRKETELLSVLSPDKKQRIGIVMAGTTAKSFKTPEKLSEAIGNFDKDLCTEVFLRELQGVLPDDDERGKLLTHSAGAQAELELLHPADRLMVRLIQLPHLSDRVKGMAFQVAFGQNMELLEKSLELLTAACTDLRNAKLFPELLNVILTLGNYMNGTNYAGGAFGFKITSINRLADTKSSSGQNFLHFLERVVSQHFPHLEGFLDELARPAEANRVNFADMQMTSKQMLEEIRNIRKSLENNFGDQSDGYTIKMFRFSAQAEDDLQTVRDGIVQSESLLRDVQTFYGEGDDVRPMQSQDFFGIFTTFTSSYKTCRKNNRDRQNEIAQRERRKAALTPQITGVSETGSTSSNLIDAKLNRLKLEGTPRIKRERRTPAPPLSPIPITSDFSDFMLPNFDGDYGTLARNLMNQINGEGGGGGGGMLSPDLEVDGLGERGMSPPSPSPIGGMGVEMLLHRGEELPAEHVNGDVDEEDDEGEGSEGKTETLDEEGDDSMEEVTVKLERD